MKSLFIKKAILLLLISLSIQGVEAQQSREDYKRELESFKQNTAINIEIFLNPKELPGKRKEAIQQIFTFGKEQHIQKAFKIIQNTNQPLDIRVLAMQRTLPAISKDADMINEILQYIGNTNTAQALRNEAMNTLQALLFGSPRLIDNRIDYRSILRKAIRDKDDFIRETSFRILCAEGDDYAQQALIKGLEKPEQALLSPATSIRLLGYDTHTGFYPTLHKIMLNPPDQETRIEAIRLLGGFAKSQSHIINYLKDKNEPIEVRRMCAASLNSNDKANFANYTKDLILDESCESVIRLFCLNALMNNASAKIENDTSFLKQLKEAANISSSEKFKAKVNYLFQKIKK